MIEHVYHKALQSGAAEVVIATDDERVREVAEDFGAQVCMTAVEHPSGTDRLAQVALMRGWQDSDIVVNVQGDEPLLLPGLIQQVAADLHTHPESGIATLCTRIREADEIFAPHAVKVVLDNQGYALYFSRAPIPYHRGRICCGL